MNNAMPVLSSEATLLTVGVTMHNHDSHAGVVITRDGLVVTIRTIAQDAPLVELMTMINWYYRAGDKVRVRINRNTATKR